VGALVIATTRERAFTEEDLQLAAEFAERAALAIDNAQLYADAQHRAHESDFLAETAALISNSRGPDEIVRVVARQATTLLGDGCGIFLPLTGERWMPSAWIEHRDPEEGRRLRAFLSENQTGFDDGPIRKRLATGEVAVLNGKRELSRIASTDASRHFIDEFGIEAMLAVTLGTRREPLGAMICVRQGPRPYTRDDARILRLVAGHAGAALLGAMLHARVESERARLAAVIDTLPEGVIIAAAPDGRLTVGNPAAIALLGRPVSGETQEEWVPEYRLTTAEGEPYPTEDLPLSRALRGETVRGLEVWVERPDGRRMPVLASAAPFYGPDGVIDEALVVFQDITTIKEAERIKDQWLSVASHELRTPITSLRGFAQLIERQVKRGDGPDRESLAAALSTISEQAGRLPAGHLTHSVGAVGAAPVSGGSGRAGTGGGSAHGRPGTGRGRADPESDRFGAVAGELGSGPARSGADQSLDQRPQV
jgi:PAS domain S-box-containing protein